ncbi:MAG: DUF4367 domain-containing protein, partial [Cohnella sp.]|nr:DUF4367 domain-containing protein [Cohnella sp.]
VYLYVNEDGNHIIFSFLKLDGQTSLMTNEGKEGIKVEQVELEDGPGILYTADNGSTRLETVANGLQVSLSGILPGDRFLRIYEQISYE